ncbi:flavin-containing monooxygenase [Rufibacter quisquiliarum]|uniref:Putative flavoprotein involved in K+ transport n=1 Tax=Rufibacter quisquiliarum TaxID=1549639 RepID=A0A839GJP1_9BACT|nr:NAD(P)-binding domain-containing protein [Rufibacter quisquiliarum]MBA9078850.1 putative flavoprotein involved in K+ transport [Rufibacter quisquiliarum]
MKTQSTTVLPVAQPHVYEVIVIGAGQAGLAMGYYLHLQRRDFLMLEAAPQVGQSWRERYDSLQLFTPAPYCHLPGFPLLLPRKHYPTKDEIARYLQQYAQQFRLPVELGQPVVSLTKKEGLFFLQTPSAHYLAQQVVVATGPFQAPFLPTYATAPAPEVVQLHSSRYRNPGQLPPGNVLVVGAGNSGAQIAVELAKYHAVHLSVKRKPRFSSLRMLGRSVFWWATVTGALYASPTSRVGKKVLRKADVIYGRELEQLLREKVIPLRPEITGFAGSQVFFKDGTSTQFSSIIWATGFQPDYRWLQIAGAITADGNPLHEQGLSPVPGLFYLGLSWQRSRSSALLLGAARDAQFIARQLL